MAASLRERQRQLAREAILDALAREVADIGSLDFSVGDVAKRAGVSHRTVYNHFGSRQDLIDAFSGWIDDRIHQQGGVIIPRELGDLPAALVTNFRIFEDQSDLAEVLARMGTAERATSAHERRTSAFVEAVAASYPKMDGRDQKMIAVLMRQIASVRAWYHMTREHGLSTTEAAAVSAWALEQLQSALDRGELPQLPSEV